jgi:hypothetical protein
MILENHPEVANWAAAQVMNHDKSLGIGYEYSFWINGLLRVVFLSNFKGL